MKINAVTVGYSRLVTGENFSNKRFSCELTAEVGYADSFNEVRDALEKECVRYVESKISENNSRTISKEQANHVRVMVAAAQQINENNLPF